VIAIGTILVGTIGVISIVLVGDCVGVVVVTMITVIRGDVVVGGIRLVESRARGGRGGMGRGWHVIDSISIQ
jgi:hypothetical protein